MQALRAVVTPRAFWLYLGAVHVAYAAFLVAGGDALHPAAWPLPISVPEFAGVVDVVAAPALIYAVLWRSRPTVAGLGAGLIAGFNLLVVVAWMRACGLAMEASVLPSARALMIGGLCLMAVAYEARVLLEVVGLWRCANFDVAITALTESPGSAIARSLYRARAVELRFWAYALIRRKPALSAFRGARHFSYGAQSANADTWIAWAVINAAPTPLLHLFVHRASPAAAIVTTIATLLGSLWCVAEARAAVSRPVSLDEHGLYLRYGLAVDRTIPRRAIRSAALLSWKDLEARNVTRYAGLGGANVRLELDDGEVIQLGLDDPHGFVAALVPVSQ